MGSRMLAKCNKCGQEFEYNHGGGFYFHLLHCENCGSDRSLGFDEIPELHSRYIKGLGGPYCIASSKADKAIQNDMSIEPIDENTYHQEIETFLGLCTCGGRYKFDARPRCPKCNSSDYKDIVVVALYD